MADKDDITQDTTVRNAVDGAADDAKEEGATGTAGEDGATGTVDDSGRGAQAHALQDIRTRLVDHVGTLRFLNSALMTCVQALQQQDADMDADIALVLQRTVGDKLDETIEHIEAIAYGVELDEEAA